MAIQGMTGFGGAEKGGFRVEVRSLNHRFLDITVKMPPMLGRHEMALREMIKERFLRGRFDVFVSTTGEEKVRFRINDAMAKELLVSLDSLKEQLKITKEIDMTVLLAWKELLIQEEPSYDIDSLYSAFKVSLDEVLAMRVKEGTDIETAILKGAERIRRINDEVQSILPQSIESARKNFRERIKAFLVEECADDTKLILEASKAVEKVDIVEETTRIKSHLSFFAKILENSGKIGRKLDFLLQELSREANTIASKSEDEEIIKKAVDMKSEIENIKELIQNIQ
ncbi:MAG: YicC family protein [Nitrospirae bacterium]|nr:YicC family protein [Nitrospirota bacterium]